MNHRTRHPGRATRRGFSLTEVTLSIGVVAALLLPTVALLVGGASLEMTSQDRHMAARVAGWIDGGLAYDREAGQFELLLAREEKPVTLPRPSGERPASLFAALDREGRWLREIDEADFRAGVAGDAEALYLLHLEIGGSDLGKSAASGGPPLQRLAVAVEQPAVAPAENRSRETFASRLAAP